MKNVSGYKIKDVLQIIVFIIILILLIILICKILKLPEPGTSILFSACFLCLLLIILVMREGLKMSIKDLFTIEKSQLESDASHRDPEAKENNIKK